MILNKIAANFIIGFLLLSLYSCKEKADKKLNKNSNQRPNIVLILADDMGFSDIGSYGSEIETPNLDKLADNGLRYTQFYNTSRCCPTRASLLTGLYPHQTGLGWMTRVDLKQPGYRGDLNNQCVTLGEVLKNAGYSTYISGKWHVNKDDECEQDSPKHNWPLHRGFDRFFGILKGASDYFNPDNLYEGDTHIQPDDNFYFTDAVNDHASKFIDEHFETNNEKPFFLYMAHIAPHWPIQAKPEDIKKYEGTYLKGWDKLREERYDRMLELGVIKSNAELSERTPVISDWDSLSGEEKTEMDKRMAIYAAQIDIMDQGIGRVIETLKKQGQFDNTIIIFLSDNGGCMQPISRGESNAIENFGTEKSFESYGEPWANVSNTPFRNYKKWEHEGGVATPLIIHWPEGFKAKGELRDQTGHVIDFMPTLLEIANIDYPEVFGDHKIIPFEGESLVATFDSNSQHPRTIYFEHIGNRGMREGDWKLVSLTKNKFPYHNEWELYNLKKDRSETINLASKYPEKVEKLETKWNAWAERTNVLPLDGRGWNKRISDPAGVQKTE